MVSGVARRAAGLTLLLTLLLAPVAQGADEAAKRERLEELRERISAVNEWLERAQRDEDEHLRRLREAEQEISRLNQRLSELQNRIAELDRELAELSDEADELEARRLRGRDGLRELVREAWMQGDHPTLKLLLTESDPQEIARLMTWHEYISRDAIARLEAFARTLEQIEENRASTEQAQNELENTREQVQAQRDQRASQQQEREKALAALQERMTDRESELRELQADRERLTELLKEMEQALADIEAPEDVAPFDSLRAQLPWPARGNVTANFGESVGRSDMRNNGIRIALEPEEAVQAVHYGRVIFANWLRGFGLMIIIDHGDGFMSLYGNNSSLTKGEGDWVRGGETIARAGDTGGRNRTGLYFEIRHNGQPQNPREWLE